MIEWLSLCPQINLDELEDLHEDMNDLLADADEINEVSRQR